MNRLRALFYREMRIWTRRPVVPLFTFISPITYLLIFGPTFDLLVPPINIAGGLTVKYSLFVVPGIIALLILNTCIMSSVMTIFLDRRSGMLEFLMGNPVSRTEYISARFMSGICQTIIQSFVLFLIGVAFFGLPLTILSIFAFLAGVTLGTVFFMSLMLIIATKITDQDTFNALLSLITPPMLFASSIFYPSETLPGVLSIISKINPLSYVSDLLRIGVLNVLPTNAIGTIIILSVVTCGALVVSIKMFMRADIL